MIESAPSTAGALTTEQAPDVVETREKRGFLGLFRSKKTAPEVLSITADGGPTHTLVISEDATEEEREALLMAARELAVEDAKTAAVANQIMPAEIEAEPASEPRRGWFARKRPADAEPVAEMAALTLDETTAPPEMATAEPEKRTVRGFLGMFGLAGKKNDVDGAAMDAPEEVGVAQEIEPAPETLAAAEPAMETAETAAEPRAKRGFLGAFKRKPDPAEPVESGAQTLVAMAGPKDAQPVVAQAPKAEPGQVLPYGTAAEVCRLAKSELGQEVDHFPREGRAIWRLYDTNPTSTGPRTQYITGLKDRCAVQFTGSLALFGGAEVHETLRYSNAMKSKSYTAADTAYESLKQRICGVGKGQRCPANKAAAIEKAVAFVTVYHRFGDTKDKLEMLLADGKLITQEVR